MNAQRGLQIHHVVFEPSLDDEVVLVAFIAKTLPGIFAHAMQCENFDVREILLTAGKYHATFAGRDVLCSVETEATEITKRSNFATVILALNGMCAIFDQLQPMSFSYGG